MEFEPIQRRLRSVLRTIALQHQLVQGMPEVDRQFVRCGGVSVADIWAVVDEHFMLLNDVERYRQQWCLVFQQLSGQHDMAFTILLRPTLFSRLVATILNDYLKAVDDLSLRALALQLWHLEGNKKVCLRWLLRDFQLHFTRQWQAHVLVGYKPSLQEFIVIRQQQFVEQVFSHPETLHDFASYRRVVRALTNQTGLTCET